MDAMSGRPFALSPTWGMLITTAATSIAIVGAWRVAKTRATNEHNGGYSTVSSRNNINLTQY